MNTSGVNTSGVNPKIIDYIQRHRATYTKEAIREGLVRDGFASAEIEAGFQAVEAGQAPPKARLSGRFWLIFLGYIVVLYGLTLLLFGLTPSGLFIVPILAVPLVIAAGISVLIAALSRSAALGATSGIVLVFAMPFVFLVVIAGSCLALTAPFLFAPQPPPPRSGTVELHIDPPLEFDGSGAAQCSGDTNGEIVFVSAESVGTLDGSMVRVSADVSRSFTNVNIELHSGDPALPPTAVYGGGAEAPGSASDVEIDREPGGLSGTITFERVAGFDPQGGTDPIEPATISGSLTWRCD